MVWFNAFQFVKIGDVDEKGSFFLSRLYNNVLKQYIQILIIVIGHIHAKGAPFKDFLSESDIISASQIDRKFYILDFSWIAILFISVKSV